MRTPQVRALAVSLMLLGTVLGACSSSAGSSRTIEVDHHHDEFAGTFRGFYPRDVTVKPGMTLKFHQTWSGEPHTVTLGSTIEDLIHPDLLPIFRKSTSVSPPDNADFGPAINAEVEKFFNETPFFFGEQGVNQAVGQPCATKTGFPQGDGRCSDHALAPFTGREGYYNSGFIPYLGTQGNEFEMKIADDAKPGTYFYFCSLHGPTMDGQITITKNGSVPSQGALNRQAQKEVDGVAKPLIAQLTKERAGKAEYKGNLAGSGSEATANVNGQVNEFTPRTVKAQVGQPVSWTFIGSHTISFNVPPYVPFYSVKKDGTVVQSESIFSPAGGWPGRTPPTQEDGPAGPAPILPAVHVDAGKFDGSGKLRSTGTDWQTGDTYSVTFTKPGTYPMACLVHPGMIGKVVVS